ncbi:MAG: hypothetical protein IOC96_12430 [Rhodobacter sp.]|nr:hypothetical protein [Rhodobacter sp.]
MLYIAIALALIVGGLVFYQQASLQSRTSSVVRAYSAFITEARAMLAEGSSVPTTSNLEELLWVRGSIPAGLWDATKPLGQRIQLPFPNMYASLGATLLPGNSNISLVEANLPISLCSRLFVASNRTLSYASGATSAVFWDENVGNLPILHTYTISPSVTPTQAGTYCRNADANGNGLVTTMTTFRISD